MKIEFQVALTTEAELILQEEWTLVKENNKMLNMRRRRAYDEGTPSLVPWFTMGGT